jgi:hypothetical protein
MISFLSRHKSKWALGLTLAAALGLQLVTGCTQTREAEHAMGIGGVPHDATKLVSGTGQQPISATANKAGTAFLQDDSSAEVLAKEPVKAGDSVAVDPKAETFTAGTTTVPVKLKAADTYSIYLH